MSIVAEPNERVCILLPGDDGEDCTQHDHEGDMARVFEGGSEQEFDASALAKLAGLNECVYVCDRGYDDGCVAETHYHLVAPDGWFMGDQEDTAWALLTSASQRGHSMIPPLVGKSASVTLDGEVLTRIHVERNAIHPVRLRGPHSPERDALCGRAVPARCLWRCTVHRGSV